MVGVQGSSDPNRELLDAAALVGHLVPAGSVYAFLAEHRGRLFPDEMFADLFSSSRGRPSQPAELVATVLVLQSLEGLSDRDAVQALRTDLRWKVAAGLALDDEGFHPTVLTYWRNRLRASQRPERIFDAVRDVVAETGVLKGKSRRALDSTLLDDAVATQDTVTQLVSMIRRVRKAIPRAAAVAVVGDDYDQATGKPACAWDDPDARDALVTRLVNDALTILDALDGVALDEEQMQLVGLLALLAGQDVEPGDSEGTWRIERKVSKHRVVSVVDPESRHMHKNRSSYRDGYKAHLAAEPTTGIITACALTPANAGDGATGVDLLGSEPEPVEVYADSAYGTAEMLAAIDTAGHSPVIKPWPLRRNPNLGDDQFVRDDYRIDYTARTVTCPAGISVAVHTDGIAKFKQHCSACPLRSRCTTARGGKTFSIGTHDQLLAANRQRWRTDPDLIADYRTHRPLIERTIAWLTRNGHRRVRYRGVERNQLGLSIRAATLNLRRLCNLGLDWHDGWQLTT
jgi:IS5 family transposase